MEEMKRATKVFAEVLEAKAQSKLITIAQSENLGKAIVRLKEQHGEQGGSFEDVTGMTEAGTGTFPHVTWGNALADFDNDGDMVEVDSRPSDAIAIALRFKAPIYVDEKVIEKSKRGDADVEVHDQSEEGKKWAEYLEKLSPEDFGKYKV